MRCPHLLVAVVLAGCASGAGPGVAPTAPPDAGRRVVAENGAVTSANPLASEAGLAMLQAGGNAVDAAVATAFAIGVVEPQMSGPGGGGAMTIWLQPERRVEYIDFYASQNAETFRTAFASGRLPPTRQGATDLRIVGIPGNVEGLLKAHEAYGRLSREQVMAPAIRLAGQGFPVNQILAQMIRSDSAKLHRFEASTDLLWPGGRPLAPGDVLRNPELAATLRLVAAEGANGFYRGDVARRIVDMLNAHGHPATLSDLDEYTVEFERPLCTEYRGHVLLSAPPPQTGLQVMHTLELLEAHDLRSIGPPTRSARAFDIMASALRVGIADRANDDPDWTPVWAAGIVSAGFARERAALVGSSVVAETIERAHAERFDRDAAPAACAVHEPYGPTPAIPGASPTRGAGDDAVHVLRHDAGAVPEASVHNVAAEPDGSETTHISVVDAQGNAVALTQTNSTTFGSGASVAGFFLNDSGFQFTPDNVGAPALDTWRTRTSTIAPTIVLKDGRVHMVIGAPGGGLIPTTIVQAMVYALDYGMDPLDAVRMPRLFPAPGSPSVQLETGFAADVLEQARRMGWAPTALAPGYARIYMIVRSGNRWIAVADPRHNGEARGY